MSSKQCPKCGRQYPASYRSCPYCAGGERGRRTRPSTLPEQIVDFIRQYGERIFLVSSVVFIMIAILGILLSRCSAPAEQPADDTKPSDQQQAQPDDTIPEPDPLLISKTSLDILTGETASLTITGGTGTPVWASSDEAVATVSAGTVTALAAGTTTISVTCGTEKVICTVTVTAPEPEVEVYLNRTDFTLRASDPPVQMKVKIVGSKKDYEGTVTWASNDVTVVTISDSGLVQRVGRGTTTVTATVGSQTVECIVRVP